MADPDRVARLVEAVDPAPDARVLDVASGPGYVALGFAASPERDGRPWQQRGRCGECGTKVAGSRRIRTCICGGRVRY